MRFRDDTRGVTVQVGAVLLFATIIIALSVYQATVVPAENGDVEYRHSQQVQGQLVDVRNALAATATTGDARPATVSLGTEYPNRVFLVNPPPPAGTLRTNTYDNPTLSVSNLNATNPETRDYLSGTWSAQTKSLSYVPDYNEYRDAPRLRYGASLLSNYYPEQNTSVPLTDQLLVDEETKTVSLVALNGSLSTSRSSSVAVDPSALSAPAQRTQVRAATPGDPVVVTVPTLVDAAVLRNATNLGDNPDVTVSDHPTDDDRVVLEVAWSGPFTLRTGKVGVGSETSGEDVAYLTLVDNSSDRVTVEARDRFNNPVAGETVNASDEFQTSNRLTDEDGQATFQVSDGESGPATLSILGNASDYERVSVPVDTETVVGNGSGSGSIVHVGNATAFDSADPNSVPGGLNFTIQNAHSSTVTITDVTVIPENADITGLSDKVTGEGPGESELSVNKSEGTNATTDVVIPDDQYVYVGDRGLTLSAETSRTERVYDTGSETFSDLETTFIGTPVTLSTDDRANVTFTEFYDVAGGGATAVNVSDEDFRVVVSYRHDGGKESSEFVVYAQEPGGGDEGPSDPGPTPEVSFRLDDLSHTDQSRVDYVGSYSIANTNSSFERVEIEYENTNDGSASQTLQKAGERGGLRYTSTYGAEDTYDVTVNVIYSDGGTEYVAASETVTDVADAQNPGGNDDLSTGGTATLDSSTIEDRSNNGQGPRYRFGYTVSGSGGYSQTELVVVATGSGDKASTTSTSRSGSNVDVNPGYGYLNEFKLAVLVYGPDGAVVDDRIVLDTADGNNP